VRGFVDGYADAQKSCRVAHQRATRLLLGLVLSRTKEWSHRLEKNAAEHHTMYAKAHREQSGPFLQASTRERHDDAGFRPSALLRARLRSFSFFRFAETLQDDRLG